MKRNIFEVLLCLLLPFIFTQATLSCTKSTAYMHASDFNEKGVAKKILDAISKQDVEAYPKLSVEAISKIKVSELKRELQEFSNDFYTEQIKSCREEGEVAGVDWNNVGEILKESYSFKFFDDIDSQIGIGTIFFFSGKKLFRLNLFVVKIEDKCKPLILKSLERVIFYNDDMPLYLNHDGDVKDFALSFVTALILNDNCELAKSCLLFESYDYLTANDYKISKTLCDNNIRYNIEEQRLLYNEFANKNYKVKELPLDDEYTIAATEFIVENGLDKSKINSFAFINFNSGESWTSFIKYDGRWYYFGAEMAMQSEAPVLEESELSDSLYEVVDSVWEDGASDIELEELTPFPCENPSEEQIAKWCEENENLFFDKIGYEILNYDIPDEMLTKHPGLVYLVLNSQYLGSEKIKKDFFDAYQYMDDVDILELYKILMDEGYKRQEIENMNMIDY